MTILCALLVLLVAILVTTITSLNDLTISLFIHQECLDPFKTLQICSPHLHSISEESDADLCVTFMTF